MEKENKEIDLFELLNRGFNLCRSYIVQGWICFLSIIKFHIRNVFILLPFLIIGTSIAIYQTVKDHRKQYCEFMLQVNGSDCFVVSDLVRVLNQAVNPDTNNVVLAKLLKINDLVGLNDVKKIYSIESYYVIDLNNNNTPDYVDYSNSFVEDTVSSRMRNLLNVRIYSKGQINFNDLQQGIVKYLLTDSYLQNVSKERIKTAQDKIQSLEVEIAVLDSLRKQQMLTGKNDMALEIDNKSIMLGKQSTSYYKDMMFLKDQKTKLLENLSLYPDVVSIYSGVTIHAEKSTIKIFIKDILVLYVCGLLLSVIIFYRKKIKSLIKN